LRLWDGANEGAEWAIGPHWGVYGASEGFG